MEYRINGHFAGKWAPGRRQDMPAGPEMGRYGVADPRRRERNDARDLAFGVWLAMEAQQL